MHYLIDGYNLFFSLSQENPSTRNRLELIELIEKLTYSANLNASIVFDSRSDIASDYASVLDHGSLEVIYSARGQSADEYIIEFVYALQEPKRYCIVTNDNGIIRQVKERGAYTKNLTSFLQMLKPKPKNYEKPESPLADHENQRLLEIFERRFNK